MFINPISAFSMYKSSISMNNKKQTQPSFKNVAYRDFVNKNARKSLNYFSDFQTTFFNLIKKAKEISGVTFHPKVKSNELLALNGSIKERLKEAEEMYLNGNIGWNETLIAKDNRPLVSMNSNGGITFHGTNEDSILGDHIDYYFDGKGDFVFETRFTETRFYDSTRNMKLFKKHQTDYKHTETIYYNKDGSENYLKNFFFG